MISPHNRIDFFWCCRFAGSSDFRHWSLQRWHQQKGWLTTLEIAGRVVSSMAFLLAMVALGLMVVSTLSNQAGSFADPIQRQAINTASPA